MSTSVPNHVSPPSEGSNKELFVCIVLQPCDLFHLLTLLHGAQDANVRPLENPPSSPVPTKLEVGETWLNHAEAARYLGISTSTLYRYACQQRVECRKLGGRLAYLRSVLDRFKEEHVRPARSSASGRGIIRTALSSGK